MTSHQKALEPAAEGVVLCEEMWQRRSGTMDQERAHVSISSLGGAERLRPAAGAGLAGHEAEIGSEIPAVVHRVAAADGGGKCGCGERAEAGDGHQLPRRLFLSGNRFEFRV